MENPNSYTGTTVVSAGTLELATPAAIASSTLRVETGGAARVGGSDATVAGLDLAGGLVDVAAGGMTVTAGMSPSVLVAGLVASRGDGSWTGPSGITSSAVAAAVAGGTPRAVGWVDNGDGSVRCSYSAPGDTNIDFSVDILDAANFLALGKFDSERRRCGWKVTSATTESSTSSMPPTSSRLGCSTRGRMHRPRPP
ncbi:MAG: hypothetical protein ACKO4T_05280 [Planctomycetaceae bacterium]